MPPEFNELPIPNQNKDNEQIEENKIKSLITDSSVNTEQEVSDIDLEESILGKIKNN